MIRKLIFALLLCFIGALAHAGELRYFATQGGDLRARNAIILILYVDDYSSVQRIYIGSHINLLTSLRKNPSYISNQLSHYKGQNSLSHPICEYDSELTTSNYDVYSKIISQTNSWNAQCVFFAISSDGQEVYGWEEYPSTRKVHNKQCFRAISEEDLFVESSQYDFLK